MWLREQSEDHLIGATRTLYSSVRFTKHIPLNGVLWGCMHGGRIPVLSIEGSETGARIRAHRHVSVHQHDSTRCDDADEERSKGGSAQSLASKPLLNSIFAF